MRTGGVVILTLDLGTTVTKADVWTDQGVVGQGRADLPSTHPGSGRAEQDPASWWPALRSACAAARHAAPEAWAEIGAIGFAAARQTIVAVDRDLTPLGPALLWSDHRAGTEARALSEALGGDDEVRDRTGQALRATSVAAKLAWLAVHRPERLEAAHWVVTPRDWVVAQLTGRMVTDPTMASAGGLHDRRGAVIDGLAGAWSDRLAPVLASATVVGGVGTEAAGRLGLAVDTPVVIGAGDRACEVMGSGAGPAGAMVSWGTAANVSQAGWSASDLVPAGLVATRTADLGSPRVEPDGDSDGEGDGSTDAAWPGAGGWQVEGGLSSAGSLLGWLAGLTGRPVDDLVTAAAEVDPGAGGVVVLPWLEGARAPWWQDGLGAAAVGLGPGTGGAELARAALEGVAFEVARVLACLDDPHRAGPTPTATRSPASGRNPDHRHRPPADRPSGVGPPAGPEPGTLALTGRGAATPAWIEIVAAVTGRPVVRRAGGQAAAVGAARLAASAVGAEWALDDLAPVVEVHHPPPDLVERYRSLATDADRLARAVSDASGPST